MCLTKRSDQRKVPGKVTPAWAGVKRLTWNRRRSKVLVRWCGVWLRVLTREKSRNSVTVWFFTAEFIPNTLFCRCHTEHRGAMRFFSATTSHFPRSGEVPLPWWFWSCCQRSTSSQSCQGASCIPPPPGKAPSRTTTSQLLWMLQAAQTSEIMMQVTVWHGGTLSADRRLELTTSDISEVSLGTCTLEVWCMWVRGRYRSWQGRNVWHFWGLAGFNNGTWFSLHPIFCHCLKFCGGADVLGALRCQEIKTHGSKYVDQFPLLCI